MLSNSSDSPQHWNEARRAVGKSSVLSAALEHTRAVQASQSAAGDVIFEVNSAEDLQGLDYNHQGDASMNTVEAWERRFALRRHTMVRAALHGWWMAIMDTLRPTLLTNEQPALNKVSYVRLYHIMVRSLLAMQGEQYDEHEVNNAADDDWRSDSRNGAMTRELFMDSIFQLADLCAAIRSRSRAATPCAEVVPSAYTGTRNQYPLMSMPHFYPTC